MQQALSEIRIRRIIWRIDRGRNLIAKVQRNANTDKDR
jgi:hypothetical protein